MLKIKTQYKGVSVEYLAGTVRVTKKIDQLTESDILTAKKWGVNLEKYFEKTIEPTDVPTELPTIEYQGVIEPKPKRKKK
jgi:predicted YcjX-like family ATPase